MSDEQCNGWTNYETWVVNLWIENVEGEHRFWQERAKELIEEHEGEVKPAIRGIADHMRDEFEKNAEELLGPLGPFVDLLGHALERVNWKEIAESHIEEAKEQAEDEPDDKEE